jgi:integrase/recombinase XerD
MFLISQNHLITFIKIIVMSAIRIKIVLRKDKITPSGKAPLYIRFTKDRKLSYLATGISIESKFWDFDKSIVKRTHPNSARVNNMLRKLETEYYEKSLKVQSNNLKIDTRLLKQEVVGSETTSFNKVAEELISRYHSEGKIGTRDKAKSILNKVKQFTKKDNISFEEMTVRFITEYEIFLTENFKNKRNTINKDLKFIKRVFNYAIQQELIKDTVNPFKKITLHSAPTHREFLTFSEIALLEDYRGNKLETKCIKTCLFQYYSGGLRISDVLLLRKKDVLNGRIELNIKKTGKQLNHTLTNKAQEILNEVVDDIQNNELVFNFNKNGLNLDNAAEAEDKYISATTALINKYLKNICGKIGLNKRISTHTFRHSFAMNALEVGIRMEELKEILKHCNMRETELYGKIKSEGVDNALRRFSSN